MIICHRDPVEIVDESLTCSFPHLSPNQTNIALIRLLIRFYDDPLGVYALRESRSQIGQLLKCALPTVTIESFCCCVYV